MGVVALEYIEVDDGGIAKLIGTRTKVRQIVMDVLNGMTPERIHEEYPHLSMAQIHAALAYYYDHKAAVDEEIAEGVRVVEEMRARNPNQLTREEWGERWKARCPDRPVPGETDEQAGSP